MKILFVSPEVLPFARAGGLGDVSHYLPRALAERGHELIIMTPKHRGADQAGYELTLTAKVTAPLSWNEKQAEIYETEVEPGIKVFFVGCDELYNRVGLYGNEFGDYEDNAERFIFFCRAVMNTLESLNLIPDVIHCHDWSSGLIPVYARTLYADRLDLSRTATVFTFHNLGSQGIFWHYDFTMTGLDWQYFTPEWLEFHGRLNMTKAGLVLADVITTVSRRYAAEVLTPQYAFGLEGVLKARRADTYAVTNGVDYNVWDPAVDDLLAANYSPTDLSGKALCRARLVEAFGLAPDERPVIAVISRLLDRKGFDLIKGAIDQLLDLPLKMVFMGRGEDKYHVLLNDLAAAHPGRIGVQVDFDKRLAHEIMAGSDIFLMPSRYEPCGLEQLYGLKYGAVPVVRATGGLDDTVIDVEAHPEAGTGFKFEEYTPQALVEAVDRATRCFKDRPAWEALMRRGMDVNYSWAKAAAEYEKIYQAALERVREKPVQKSGEQ